MIRRTHLPYLHYLYEHAREKADEESIYIALKKGKNIIPYPDDFLKIIRITVNDCVLKCFPHDGVFLPYNAKGVPEFFCFCFQGIKLYPIPSQRFDCIFTYMIFNKEIMHIIKKLEEKEDELE